VCVQYRYREVPICRKYIKSITRPNLILANLMLGRNPEQREGERAIPMAAGDS
jgi:hypothetical protein